MVTKKEVFVSASGTTEQMKNIMYLHQETVKWIQTMLLHDEIRLKDIPQEIRVSDSGFYVMALRISNKLSCKRFIKDLNILCQDIYILGNNNPYKGCLLRTLASYLNLNDHRKESEFIDFQKNIHEEILCELRRKEEFVWENIGHQLKSKGIV